MSRKLSISHSSKSLLIKPNSKYFEFRWFPLRMLSSVCLSFLSLNVENVRECCKAQQLSLCTPENSAIQRLSSIIIITNILHCLCTPENSAIQKLSIIIIITNILHCLCTPENSAIQKLSSIIIITNILNCLCTPENSAIQKLSSIIIITNILHCLCMCLRILIMCVRILFHALYEKVYFFWYVLLIYMPLICRWVFVRCMFFF